MSEKLGTILTKANLITPSELDQALEFQRKNGGRLGTSLVKMGLSTAGEIAEALSRQCGVPSVNLDSFEVDPSLIGLIPMETALDYQVLPLRRVGSSLSLAMADPSDESVMNSIKFMTGFNIEPVVSSEYSLEHAIKRYYGPAEEEEHRKEIEELANFIYDESARNVKLQSEDEAALNLAPPEKAAQEAPVIKLVNYILTDAVEHGASEIHLEPYEKEYRVRYRIDGVLQRPMLPPVKSRNAIIRQVKALAKLEASEKGLPQDGRMVIRLLHNGKKKQLDFRVSMLLALQGEKFVFRLLDKETYRLDMADLGFEPESFDKFRRAIFKPYGLVLVTGPTDSGKTTTIYSSIGQLDRPDINILTAEDPVEFQLPGIFQVQVKEQIGVNFAAVLRSFLRQDADVIVAGELRDLETAEIAIKAALTGHLVLSVLDAKDAASTLSWLTKLGIKPFLLATSVHLICAQRLARRICQQCKVEHKVSFECLVDAGFTPEEARSVKVCRGEGCPVCNGKGYKGRVGLYEVLEITDELREMILVGASALDLKEKAIEEGMISLRRSGLLKVAAGLTTLEEVIRETVP